MKSPRVHGQFPNSGISNITAMTAAHTVSLLEMLCCMQSLLSRKIRGHTGNKPDSQFLFCHKRQLHQAVSVTHILAARDQYKPTVVIPATADTGLRNASRSLDMRLGGRKRLSLMR